MSDDKGKMPEDEEVNKLTSIDGIHCYRSAASCSSMKKKENFFEKCPRVKLFMIEPSVLGSSNGVLTNLDDSAEFYPEYIADDAGHQDRPKSNFNGVKSRVQKGWMEKKKAESNRHSPISGTG